MSCYCQTHLAPDEKFNDSASAISEVFQNAILENRQDEVNPTILLLDYRLWTIIPEFRTQIWKVYQGKVVKLSYYNAISEAFQQVCKSLRKRRKKTPEVHSDKIFNLFDIWHSTFDFRPSRYEISELDDFCDINCIDIVSDFEWLLQH